VTEGKGLTIQSFLNSSFHPVKSSRVMFFLRDDNNRAVLNANAMGLDILIEKYGNRINAHRIGETEQRIKGNAPELKYLYEVTLNGIENRSDIGRIIWEELAMLCIEHPFDIKIIKPEGLVDCVITSLERIKDGKPDCWQP
jgi:hypothetical protein